MQPRRDERMPGDIPQPLSDIQRRTPLANYQDRSRVHASSKRPGEQGGDDHSENGIPSGSSRRLALPRNLYSTPKTNTHLECSLPKAAIEARLDAAIALLHKCPHRATNGSLSVLPALIRSLHLGGEPPPGAISLLPLHNAP